MNNQPESQQVQKVIVNLAEDISLLYQMADTRFNRLLLYTFLSVITGLILIITSGILFDIVSIFCILFGLLAVKNLVFHQFIVRSIKKLKDRYTKMISILTSIENGTQT